MELELFIDDNDIYKKIKKYKDKDFIIVLKDYNKILVTCCFRKL